MTSRELVIRALNHEPVDRVPRALWPSPAVAINRRDELAEIEVRFPRDIVPPDFRYPPGKRSKGGPYRPGLWTDALGCTWECTQRGTQGELRRSPLAEASKLAHYRPPLELLERARLSGVNQSVRRLRRALDFGSGGLVAQCHWERGVPLPNIATVFAEWVLTGCER